MEPGKGIIFVAGMVALLLAPLGVAAQEAKPQPTAPVRDQNRSGAPQRAQKAAPTDAAILASQGMKAFEKQDFATAITRFGQAISQDPADTTSRFYLALSLSMSGKDSAALPHYAKLVEAQPEVYEIRLNYGQALANAKKFGEAAAQLVRADELKPGQENVLYLLGYAELSGGDAESARKRFDAVLALNASNADAQYGIAQAALQMGDREAAENAFRKAGDLHAPYRDGLLNLAETYEKEGNFEKAASLYAEFPDNAEAKKRSGELLLEHGKAEEAIASLEDVVKADPRFENRYTLAVAYLRSGDAEKATQQLQAAVETEPGNPEAHVAYGRVLRDARKFPEAAAQFGEAIKLNPKDAMAWSEFAGVAVMAEQYQAAFDAIGQIEKLGALKPGHHYLRAIILDKFQNDEMAIAEYELFLAASDGHNSDEEFKARQRVRILKNKKKR